MPSLMLCLIGFVRTQIQIARHWSHLIPEYCNHLNLGHHLNPRIAIEKMGKISHQRNSWIQTIAKMKTMRTRMMRAVATELQTGYHHHPFVAWHNR